ncbi:MAG: TRAP transporter small permease [Lachnospiraceae bacterium]|nr:TRAP transporter small permease [Lachnospiraceae bacterium]
MKKAYKNLEEVILCILLTILVCVSGLQVIARYLFNNSLTWSEELCRYLYVWTGFITISFVIKKGTIIKIDTLLLFLPEKLKKLLDVITSLISLAVVSILFKNAILIVQKAMASGQTSAAMKLPMWIVYMGPAIGFLLAIIRLAEHLVFLFMKRKEES